MGAHVSGGTVGRHASMRAPFVAGLLTTLALLVGATGAKAAPPDGFEIRVFGGRGNDLLIGGAGHDRLVGGTGRDTSGGEVRVSC